MKVLLCVLGWLIFSGAQRGMMGNIAPDIKSQQVTQRAINQPDYEPYFEGKVLIKGLILFIPKQYELPLVSPFSLL